MALVPLEGEAKTADSGVLDLTDRQIQQAGVRFGTVQKRDLVKVIDTFGQITYDERRLARVTSWVGGRVEKLHVNFTGETVRRGDRLVELYSAPLVVAVEQFREAKNALARLMEGSPHESAVQQAKDLIQSTRVLLVRQGLEEEQVREIEETIDAGKDPLAGGTVPTISIRAKMSGVVIEKRVEEGAYVKEGSELLRIVDLSAVWLNAEVYENELPFVDVGTTVRVSTRARPGEEFDGAVAFVDPFLQSRTRTVRVRIDVPNGDLKLKPGMFARARIRSEIPGVRAVPETAVLHSGIRKIAFVREGKGRFRPKLLRLGRMWLAPALADAPRKDALDFALDQYERYHEVLEGLAEGDEVAVAGNFLLGAESQFQGLLKKMLEEEEAPADAATAPCAWDGMEMPVAKMTGVDEGGERIYFCSAEDETHYHRSPDRSWRAWAKRYREAMNGVLAAYFAVGDSLANDKTDPGGFGALEAAAALPPTESHFDARALKAAEDAMTAIRRAAAGGRATEDLIEQRRAFGLVSIELVRFVKAHAPEKIANGDVVGYRCGMAGSRHQIATEDWLQLEKGRRNPYMGLAMPG